MQEVRHKPLKTILLAFIIEAQCSAGMKEHSKCRKTLKKYRAKTHTQWNQIVCMGTS